MTEVKILDRWRSLVAVSFKDASRKENSPLTRASASWEAGYVSALIILGLDAAKAYQHPSEQVFHDVQAKLNWSSTNLFPGVWFLENKYEMAGTTTEEQETIAEQMDRWARQLWRAASLDWEPPR